MATRLKRTLTFSLAPGASATLVHDLDNGSVPVAPDIIFIPSPDLAVVSSDETNVVIRNDGGTLLEGAVLVEYWHTIERAFGDVANLDLTVKPYIVVGGEIPNSPPIPPFVEQTLTIYARLTGNDTTGTGTLLNPYRTFQRAIRDVPNIIPPGTMYVVDCTGIGVETLPDDFVMPVWKTAQTNSGYDFSGQYFYIRTAVRLSADPQLASALTPTEATITALNGVWNGPNLITGLLSITDPTQAWVPGALAGLLLKGAGGVFDSAVIYDNTADTLFLSIPFQLTFPLQIMEQSATLEGQAADPTGFGRAGIYAGQEDCVVFAGMRIRPIALSGSKSFLSTGGVVLFEMCEIESAVLRDPEFTPEFVSSNVLDTIIDGQWYALWSRFSAGCSFGDQSNGSFLGAYSNVYDGCNSVGRAAPAQMAIQGCLIQNSLADGVAHVGVGSLVNCEIKDSVGNGVLVQGPTRMVCRGVGGTGNGGVGIRVMDGAQVERRASTFANSFDTIPMPVTAATNANPTELTTQEPHGLTTGDTVGLLNIFPSIPPFTSAVVTVTGANTFTVAFDTTADPAYAGGGLVFLPVETTVTGTDDQEVGDLGPDSYPATPFNINDIGIPGTSAGGATGTNARLYDLTT